ncbi:unnamed protein product, partial [Rotaria magnacalcarata]
VERSAQQRACRSIYRMVSIA